jgi:hypothetical protein
MTQQDPRVARSAGALSTQLLKSYFNRTFLMVDLPHSTPPQDKCNMRTMVPGELHITNYYTRQINNKTPYISQANNTT